MTDLEIAWVAGIIEGEGCISINNGRRDYDAYPLLRVAMTDEDVIRRLHRVTGVGHIQTSERADTATGKKRKRSWTWSVGARNEVKEILLAIRPWMSERRSGKISEALFMLERPPRKGPTVNPCGTNAAANRHQRAGEPLCEPCRIAKRQYNRDWERGRK